MVCIRRNICISITLEFRTRMEISINNISMKISSSIAVSMSISVHRSIRIHFNFNRSIIIRIKAEAGECQNCFHFSDFFFVFLVFEFWIFGFYIAKPKVQTTKTTNIQKNKKTKLRRHSP